LSGLSKKLEENMYLTQKYQLSMTI